MIKGPPQLPAACDACGHRVPFERISERCYEVLLDAAYHEEWAREVHMLERVAAFYQRNSPARGQIQPHAMRVLRSDDPSVRQQMFRDVPLSQIGLPPAPEPGSLISEPHPDDAEVIEYLRHNCFRLEGRLQFAREQMERSQRALDRVKCPRCHDGRMQLVHSPPPEGLPDLPMFWR